MQGWHQVHCEVVCVILILKEPLLEFKLDTVGLALIKLREKLLLKVLVESFISLLGWQVALFIGQRTISTEHLHITR